MKAQFLHTNFNVMDIEKSIAFYQEALGLSEVRRVTNPDGEYILVFLSDGTTAFQLELTWLRDWEKNEYDLGDNEFHLAFHVADKEAAYKHHQEMGCVCFENEKMNLYFIADPDGYWLEILGPRR